MMAISWLLGRVLIVVLLVSLLETYSKGTVHKKGHNIFPGSQKKIPVIFYVNLYDNVHN